MNQNNLNKKELEEILELAQQAEQQAKKMCALIMEHPAKYQRWYEEAQIKQVIK